MIRVVKCFGCQKVVKVHGNGVKGQVGSSLSVLKLFRVR